MALLRRGQGGPLPDLGAEGVHDPLEEAVVTPFREVVVDRTLGQQVVRQEGPLAAGAILKVLQS
jgi:hypothetical protein